MPGTVSTSTGRFVKAALAVIVLLGLPVQAAFSALIQRDFLGANDCSGYFGTGFDSCTIFVNDGGETIELSPVIAKYNGGDLSLSETNGTVFPTVNGLEFGFSNTTMENKTGDWSYTQGTGDPGARYWAAKAGNGFRLFWQVSATAAAGVCSGPDTYILACLTEAQTVNAGTWTTPENKALSHITFYDTQSPQMVPVPAAAWLFGSALLGLAGIARRHARAAS